MYEKLKKLESQAADIIGLLKILHKAAENYEDLSIIEPFCRVLLEKSRIHFNSLDNFTLETFSE